MNLGTQRHRHSFLLGAFDGDFDYVVVLEQYMMKNFASKSTSIPSRLDRDWTWRIPKLPQFIIFKCHFHHYFSELIQ